MIDETAAVVTEVQPTPVQLQWWVVVALDHDEREFMGSLMADLKVNRISASDGVDDSDDEEEEEALMAKTRRNVSESESVQ